MIGTTLILLLQLGTINPLITQANIKDTICKSGWTKTVRPSSAFTTKLKITQMKELKLTGKPKDYEEDHIIALELGGNPIDPANLWPQAYSPKPGAREKDQVENYLHKQVCSGKITLAEAQRRIRENWLKEYYQLKK